MEENLGLKSQPVFVGSLRGYPNIGKRILYFDRMTNFSLNFIVQSSLKTTLDPNLIA